MKSGQRKSAYRKKRLRVFTVIRKPAHAIISGSMAQDRADRVLKSTMTEGKNTDAAVRTVRWAVTVTALWKSGITYLPSLKETVRAVTQSFPRKI